MIRAAHVVLIALVLVPAAVGTSTTRSPVALTASPAHVALVGTGKATIRVTNSGRGPVVVDARRAGFALDLRGRPRIVSHARVRAVSWLTLRPRRFALRSGERTSLTVSSKVPRGAEPGDHNALVLLTTRPRRSAGVAVRMRIGVLIVVRAPGRVVRRLELRELRVRRAGRLRTLELLVANRGNVTAALVGDRVTISLLRRGKVAARLRPESRDLLPRTRGIVQFPYRGGLRGRVTALARLSSERGDVSVSRTYRIRL